MTKRHTITTVHRSPITLLENEWTRMNHSLRVLRTVNSWGLGTCEFHSLNELLHAAGFRTAKSDAVADQTLAKLVRRAATDELAGRIVLQRVLPPLISIAQRRGRIRSTGFDDALGMVLSHAWEVIRTYPIERRPAKIAANIVRDVEYFAFVRSERRRPTIEILSNEEEYGSNTRSADLLSHEDPFGRTFGESLPEIELEHLLQQARDNNVSEKSLSILRALSTQSLDEFAAEHQITRRTARDWMLAATNELRVRTQCAA